MQIKTNTGGSKDFVYDEEAKKRIEGVHTEPTRKFIEKYNEWREKKKILYFRYNITIDFDYFNLFFA